MILTLNKLHRLTIVQAQQVERGGGESSEIGTALQINITGTMQEIMNTAGVDQGVLVLIGIGANALGGVMVHFLQLVMKVLGYLEIQKRVEGGLNRQHMTKSY